MVYASVRRGPYGGGPLLRIDRDAAEAVPGVIAFFENPWCVGVVASTWWAATCAGEVMKPAFGAPENPIRRAGIEDALAQALEADEGVRVFGRGAIEAASACGPLAGPRYSAE